MKLIALHRGFGSPGIIKSQKQDEWLSYINHIPIPSLTSRVHQRHLSSAERGQIHRCNRRTSSDQLGCSGVQVQIRRGNTPPAIAPKRCFSGCTASTQSAPPTVTVVVNSILIAVCMLAFSLSFQNLFPKPHKRAHWEMLFIGIL